MLSAQAQHVQESNFCSPFDFPILLSANFGELRPNHFHNGLDIKTQGVTGKPIHCIADGYVSRVAVLHGRMKNAEKDAVMRDFAAQSTIFWLRRR